jgi:hypothetical protein
VDTAEAIASAAVGLVRVVVCLACAEVDVGAWQKGERVAGDSAMAF